MKVTTLTTAISMVSTGFFCIKLGVASILPISIMAEQQAPSSSSSSIRGTRMMTDSEESIIDTSSSLSNEKHPTVVIYTFYSRIDRQYEAENKNHDSILATWEKAWREMGWEPKVLTLDHAKKHPEYDNFNRALDRLPLDGKSGAVGDYNRVCYLRWLAMSTVGGWFADFDTVPLRRPTIIDLEAGKTGKFNVYHRFHVPALVSGSKEEWNRMSTLLIESGLNHMNKQKNTDTPLLLWSDMNALQYVVDNRLCECNVYNKVAEGRFFLDGKPIEPGECWIYRKDLAAHFSHDAMRFGRLEEGLVSVKDRHSIMQHWFDAYKEKCGIE